MHATLPLLEAGRFPALRRRGVETLQVNLGYRCNQSCVHCHVNAGPSRTEQMDDATLAAVLDFVRARRVRTLDITGGAPELHPRFRDLVGAARRLGARVIDRCNLTVLEAPGQEATAAFLAAEQVEVVASLPCYTAELVDRQRGRGVYASSIRALLALNRLGYGAEHSGLELNLVYNPQGPSLPPPQPELEADYRRILRERHGIRFNRLLTMANMPIARFGSMLVSKGQFSAYMRLLRDAHRDENLEQVMCRALVSVDWQGYVYDCDFNQMLGLPLRVEGRRRPKLADLLAAGLEGNPVAVREHCFGCTAGQGSSCGGALRG
ncbi:MAG: arsenosugar biosynthesis radical SAM (seleno)protein ArsS [Betaproteobacteria bacterium]